MVKDRKAWHVAVHGVEKRWTQLSHWKTNEWQGHSNYFGKMVEISRNSTTTHFLIFYGWPWKMVPLGVSFSLQMCYNEHMLRLRSQFSSVAQSCLTVSTHGLQHASPPCLLSTPGVYPNSCPSNWWCHPIISSSIVPFSSCLQSFPLSGFFQKCQFFTSGGQSIGVLTSTSVLPINIQDWFPLGWTG